MHSVSNKYDDHFTFRMRANKILDISYSKKPKSVYDGENKVRNKDENKE